MKTDWPLGTVAFYGPTDRHASKVAVGIQFTEGDGVDRLEHWFENDLDVRVDSRIGEAVVAFLQAHGVRSVVVARGILGCPHEEGIDYPEGERCPACPFWLGRDRWANA